MSVRGIEAHLRARERRRDRLFEESRRLRRTAQAVMAAIHEGREVGRRVGALRRAARRLSSKIRAQGGSDTALAHDALQESAEACMLDAISSRRPFPTPDALGVDPEVYLSGLGDLVGEVRRLTLECLATGDLEGARFRLAEMEAVYRTLLRFETPRAIVPLKPKQDQARALLERTRGDVTVAAVVAHVGPAARGTEGSS